MTVVPLPARSPVTVADAVASLLDSPRLSARTAVTYHESLARFIEDVGGDTPVGTVDIGQVEAHLTGRYAHRSPAYYNRSRAAISALFTHAARRGWATSNPVLRDSQDGTACDIQVGTDGAAALSAARRRGSARVRPTHTTTGRQIRRMRSAVRGRA